MQESKFFWTRVSLDHPSVTVSEAREIDEETGKLYHFNIKKGQTQTMKLESKN
jgi:hypothetical protein